MGKEKQRHNSSCFQLLPQVQLHSYRWFHESLLYPYAKCPCTSLKKKKTNSGFPSGAVIKNLPANAGDTGSSPGLGRSHMPRSN